jgi:hypothetical protein
MAISKVLARGHFGHSRLKVPSTRGSVLGASGPERRTHTSKKV